MSPPVFLCWEGSLPEAPRVHMEASTPQLAAAKYAARWDFDGWLANDHHVTVHVSIDGHVHSFEVYGSRLPTYEAIPAIEGGKEVEIPTTIE